MKKFIFTGLFIASLSTIVITSCSSEDSVKTRGDAFMQKDDDGPRDPSKGIHIGAKWKFGTRSSECKKGIGFCKYENSTIGDGNTTINIDKTIKKVQTIISGSTTKSSKNRTLRIEFETQEYAEFAFELFGGTNVIFEETTTFDTNDMIKEGLDVVENFTVLAGSYPITFDKSTGLYGFTLVSATN